MVGTGAHTSWEKARKVVSKTPAKSKAEAFDMIKYVVQGTLDVCIDIFIENLSFSLPFLFFFFLSLTNIERNRSNFAFLFLIFLPSLRLSSLLFRVSSKCVRNSKWRTENLSLIKLFLFSSFPFPLPNE